MKKRLLTWLCSPCCRGDFKIISSEKPENPESEITTGSLSCLSCRKEYPIIDGVPRLLPQVTNAQVLKTRESFAWEWNRYPGSLPEDKPLFLEETQIPEEEFRGKLVMDAGCGMGRYAKVALSLGAEVVAFDLSDACLRLTASMKETKLHVVQGDLLNPPLKNAAFDIIYSQGVLHHTSNTQAAFKRVAQLVKAGGLFSVWLYGKAGRFEEFATNPIREGRGWIERHRRLAWSVVAVRHLFSDLVRAATVKMPVRLSYALCYPLTALGAVPGLKYLTFSVHPDFQVRLIENFDWISPPFQYHHTKEELCGWFKEAGFSVMRILPHGLVPKPGVLGRKTG